MDTLVNISGLTVRYGGVVAVSDVSFSIGASSFVGLIGPNGAGKTTFIDALTGFTRSSGAVEFDGEQINGLPSHQRARRGVARTFQSLELFEELTVRENLLVAADPPRWWSPFVDPLRPRPHADAIEIVADALEVLDISDLAGRSPKDLSLGQRKLVTVARALCSRPSLLLLDEPAAGLDSGEALDFGTRMRRLVEERGTSVLLVDHDMGLVLGVCDRIHVLEFGRLIASGTPAEVRANERVIAAYLGGARDTEAVSEELAP